MAVERFRVSEGFGGATCVWYSAAPADSPRLHCTTTNRTVAPLLTVTSALIHASVQVIAHIQPTIYNHLSTITYQKLLINNNVSKITYQQ